MLIEKCKTSDQIWQIMTLLSTLLYHSDHDSYISQMTEWCQIFGPVPAWLPWGVFLSALIIAFIQPGTATVNLFCHHHAAHPYCAGTRPPTQFVIIRSLASAKTVHVMNFHLHLAQGKFIGNSLWIVKCESFYPKYSEKCKKSTFVTWRNWTKLTRITGWII